MKQLWNPIVGPLQSNIQKKLDEGTASAKAQGGDAALEAIAKAAHASVIDGSVQVDWANEAQRSYWVKQIAPSISQEMKKGDSSSSSSNSSLTSDTSFLNGADPLLTKPFMVGFTQSAVTIYWVGFGVLILAFVLSWFFKVPPLRQRSALQEMADEAGTTDTGTIKTQGA